MRIIVMSDSHGNNGIVTKIIDQNIYTADMFVHLGDGEMDMIPALEAYSNVKVCQVKGNCDRTDQFSKHAIIETVQDVDGKLIKIFVTHGHIFGVKQSVDNILKVAKDNDCRVALFGHTHLPFEETRDGILLLNPGSCALPRTNMLPTYAYLDVSMWGIISGIVNIN